MVVVGDPVELVRGFRFVARMGDWKPEHEALSRLDGVPGVFLLGTVDSQENKRCVITNAIAVGRETLNERFSQVLQNQLSIFVYRKANVKDLKSGQVLEEWREVYARIGIEFTSWEWLPLALDSKAGEAMLERVVLHGCKYTWDILNDAPAAARAS